MLMDQLFENNSVQEEEEDKETKLHIACDKKKSQKKKIEKKNLCRRFGRRRIGEAAMPTAWPSAYRNPRF
jgi:hypothetical protein